MPIVNNLQQKRKYIKNPIQDKKKETGVIAVGSDEDYSLGQLNFNNHKDGKMLKTN